MKIDFIKMHGAGNDYVYIDLVDAHARNRLSRVDFGDLATKISSRHFGVGGDGLVLMLPSRTADCRMRMFNSDGSEAEMCGNAIRCVGKHIYDRGYFRKKNLAVETLAGIKRLFIVGRGGSGKESLVKVDMGFPFLKGKDIPIGVEQEPVVGVPLEGRRGTAVGMGNPHIVFFVNEITDRQVLEDGPKIERHPLFPRKTNVEFVQVLDRKKIRMRVWERGAGETLACGTGACASVVAAVLNGLTDRIVDVHLTGGVLNVEWDERSGAVFMTGPAAVVFTGVYHYSPPGCTLEGAGFA